MVVKQKPATNACWLIKCDWVVNETVQKFQQVWLTCLHSLQWLNPKTFFLVAKLQFCLCQYAKCDLVWSELPAWGPPESNPPHYEQCLCLQSHWLSSDIIHVSFSNAGLRTDIRLTINAQTVHSSSFFVNFGSVRTPGLFAEKQYSG